MEGYKVTERSWPNLIATLVGGFPKVSQHERLTHFDLHINMPEPSRISGLTCFPLLERPIESGNHHPLLRC